MSGPDHGPLRHALIVGGGASGVLLAAQLLRRGAGRVAVTLVERGPLLGCGVAYSTSDPAHLLNTRVANMSAYPSRPDHFLDWLRAEEPGDGGAPDPQGFVTRATYGRYLGCLLDPWAGGPLLRLRRAECTGLEPHPGGVTAWLVPEGALGGAPEGAAETVEADLAVLATGHAPPAAGPGLSQPWEPGPGDASPPEGPVLIVGSGLTMVDQVLSLLDAGHPGPLVAVSRRGLLPQVHGPSDPVCWRACDLPARGAVAPLARWLRAEALRREAEGGGWRDVVDGLRPHLQAIWQGLSPTARRTFLRHGAPFWEVHRHRMPPSSRARLDAGLVTGRLRLLRGRFEGARRDEGGALLARVAAPGEAALEWPVARIIDCRGPRRDGPPQAAAPIAGLLAGGHAALDPLGLGLDVGPDCAVLRPDGTPQERLFALGPASRAAFWEVTAIPDIRAQAERLAILLLGRQDEAAEAAEAA